VDDDLNAPLGLAPTKARRRTLPRAVPIAIAGLLGAALLGFAGWGIFTEDPLGGEPAVIVSLQSKPAKPNPAGDAAAPGAPTSSGTAAPAGPAAADPNANAAAAAPKPETKTVTIIDGVSGRREQVTISAGAETKNAPGDPRLLESSRHGNIPKVATDGARAAEVYASPQAKTARGSGPRVVIVLGRLGTSANLTAEALAKLPSTVTLAFTPYSTDLDRWVGRARSEGREVLLQVPMEPFDYPDNDPGPQALLIASPPEQNVDRLQWAMSRTQGYVGLSNYMGARFVTNEGAMTPVLREAGKRGLVYFDDGSSARSLTAQLAAAHNVALVKADLVLDATPSPAEIDNALNRLEALARERGIAVGSATAMPVSIDRIVRWSKAAAGRGVTIVPLTVAASKPKQS
jgi:polysaccharide deacetylase 2 family uncharacterized protein YibQ